MRIIIVRHGETQLDLNQGDKVLTKKGKIEIAALATFIKNQAYNISEIWHSSKTRAVQTTQILAKTLEITHLKSKEALLPESSIEENTEFLQDISFDTLILVSHLPLVRNLVGYLTTKKTMAMCLFEPGTAVCLQNIHGQYDIEWCISPSLVQ